MFVWNLNPVAFSLGPLEVRWYGIVYALGFLLGWWVLRRAAHSGSIKNLTSKLAEDFIFWLIVGGVLGGRLGEILFYAPAYYFRNPSEILAVWHGGMSIHGGLIGAILVTLWWCRKHRVAFYQVADTLVAPLAFVLVFGRLANFVNGELWGRVTDVPWCVKFPGADGCRHPSQIYEALYSLALFGVLMVMRARKVWRDGVIFWTFIGLYGVMRFAVTFYREFDAGDPALLGLSIGQWLCIVMVGVAAWWFITNRTSLVAKRRSK